MNRKEKIEIAKNFVKQNVRANMDELEAKRVRGWILASLGEL